MHPLMLEIVPLVRQGYCCSQILMLLVFEAQGLGNPGLVRALSGLCQGMGQSGSTCGLLTGGACVLGYLAGHGPTSESADSDAAAGWPMPDAQPALPLFQPLVNDYVLWFEEHTASCGSCACSAITASQGTTPAGVGAHPAICGDLLGACWDKIVELLDAYELDMARPR